jgi:FkbM family methyltransferase
MPVLLPPSLRRIAGRARRFWRTCLGPRDCIMPRETIARFLPEDPVIVEAGAAGGEDTALSARFWPRSRIFGFEPVPQSYRRLIDATADLPNVTAIPEGLFDRAGEMPMHLSNNGFGSSSVLKPTGHLAFHPEVQFDQTITIRVTTLDAWAARERVGRIDFLWLDMQGAELAALKHGQRVLEHVCAIHTEVSLRPTYENAPLYPELRAWLGARGFIVAKKVLPYADMGNVLFVNRANLLRRRAAASPAPATA